MAADGCQMSVWHKVGDWPLRSEDVDEVREYIYSLAAAIFTTITPERDIVMG